MKAAEFGEATYEGYLYDQLEGHDGRFWTPERVFEHHLGFDRAFFLADDFIFLMHHRRRHLRGVRLDRIPWLTRMVGPNRTRELPDFRLNLFIQAKRPWVGKRLPKALTGKKKVVSPFLRFNIEPGQQRTLEHMASKMQRGALYVYASAAFHTSKDLFHHRRERTIIPNSTFPSVVRLKGHEAWYYNEPGAVGIANPEPEEIEEPSLEQRITDLIEASTREQRAQQSQQQQPVPWQQTLKQLSGSIVEGLSSKELPDDEIRDEFFDQVERIQRDVEDFPEAEVLQAFLTVDAFTDIYSLRWSIVGSAKPREQSP